jgi:Asp-tRNA(Asn)/Glu-tRNA(Gln) amidotransferase A subunit family amidase
MNTLRIGIPRPYFYDDLDDDVRAAVEQALTVIRTLVAEIREIQIEIPADRVVQNAESYAIHADDVSRTPELYQAETVRRIRSGESISAAEYIRRRQDLDRERRRAQDIFAEVDFLVTPTTRIPAPAIADLKKDPEALRPAEITLLRNTRPFNVWGLPAISLPCGFTQSGLPIGLQIAGPPWREDLVLRLAHAYEQATTWHKRKPAS